MYKIRKVVNQIIKWKIVEILLMSFVFFVRGYVNNMTRMQCYVDSMSIFDINNEFSKEFIVETSLLAGLAQAIVFTGGVVYVFSIFALGISENKRHRQVSVVLLVIMCIVVMMYVWFVANFHFEF